VVANGSSLAYAKNAGASLSTLRLCDFATLRYIRGTQRRDDARAQRLETTESIRIRKVYPFCQFRVIPIFSFILKSIFARFLKNLAIAIVLFASKRNRILFKICCDGEF